MGREDLDGLLKVVVAGSIGEGGVGVGDELITSLKVTDTLNFSAVPDGNAVGVSVAAASKWVVRSEFAVEVHLFSGVVLVDILRVVPAKLEKC